MSTAPTDQKIVLHVGCGAYNPQSLHARFQGEGWRELRLDIDPEVQPDILGSMVDMSQVESSSVDAVWSSHNLEHLYSHEVPVALGEFWRVLRPGGEALVTMPDLQGIAKFVADGLVESTLFVSPQGPISAIDILFGFRASIAEGNEFMAHRTGFTARSLREKLEDAGFGEIVMERQQFPPALWALAKKPSTVLSV